MKRIFKQIALILSLSCALTACTADISTIDEIEPIQIEAETTSSEYFGINYYSSESINPITSISESNEILIEALYEGLFVLDDEFNPINVLCESYQTDGISWTFKLDDDILFWNGLSLTADDVAYSYNLAINTPTSPYNSRLQNVESITVISYNTIEIILKEANTQFVKLLDIPIFQEGTEINNFSVGTGPYMPQSDGVKKWLVPNTFWHKSDTLAFEYIQLFETMRSDAAVYSFETGDISITRADRISATPAQFKGTAETHQTPTTNMHFLCVNYGRAPMNLSQVRTAIAYAIDRVRLCSIQLQDFADPAILPVNPAPDTALYSYYQNIMLAESSLDAVGIIDTDEDGIREYIHTDGTKNPFTPVILVNSENEYKVSAVNQIVAELEVIGIRATVSALPYAEYLVALANGEYDICYAETIMTADFNLSPLLSLDGSANFSNYSNYLTDTFIGNVKSSHANTLLDAQYELYDHLLQTMPIIPLAFTRGQIITRNGLIKDFSPLPFQAFANVENWKVG